MERINWSDPVLSGGLFEKIVACLLGNEFGDTVRIRPSQGDGGVDILRPVATRTIDVYQAKHFTRQIDWSKVEASLSQLADGAWFGYDVRNWYLTVPKQPTPQDYSKLGELGSEMPFSVGWFGEDDLASLTAKYPHIGDYYLGDGKAQLMQRLRDWQSVFDPVMLGDSPSIEEAQARLIEIADALGRNDPHLTYGVEVQPAHGFTGPHNRPGLVLVTAATFGDRVVACYVYGRYRGADLEAGERLAFGLELTPAATERLVVCRGFGDAIEGGSSALDLGDDVVDGLGPHERLRVVVPV